MVVDKTLATSLLISSISTYKPAIKEQPILKKRLITRAQNNPYIKTILVFLFAFFVLPYPIAYPDRTDADTLIP